MEIRKYLFWITDKGIQTYKVVGKRKFELVRFRGESMYTDIDDIIGFEIWFNRMASITGEEYVDFCYLSENPDRVIDFTAFKYKTTEKSSWNKEEITIFFEQYTKLSNYEVLIDEERKFVCQSGNLLNKDNLKKIYLKCYPEFSLGGLGKNKSLKQSDKKVKQKENVLGSDGETSLVNRYFRDMLKDME